jgi:hypothetical protein
MTSGVGGRVGGSFDEFSVVDGRTGPDQGDEMRCVQRPPAGLGGFDEFVGMARGPGPGSFR